ncbi:MAG: two-component regulator propeller domain-containing protein [Acidobacteriota bacterium]|nr:two-component regulator propeller domain-containing protein [Acidobacteriota bacterium]
MVGLFLLAGLIASVHAHAQVKRFKTERITVEQGLSINSVRCMLQGPKGYLWLGTHNGLNQYDGYNFTIYKNEPGNPYTLSSYKIYALCQEPDGTLWLATGKGINRFDPKTGKVTRYLYDEEDPYSISSNATEAIYLDKLGTIWVGTDGGGVNIYDRERDRFINHRNDLPDSLRSITETIMSFHEDRFGSLWVGAKRKGLFRYDRTNHDVTLYKSDSFPEINNISSIVEDGSGSLWLGGPKGLCRYDRENDRFFLYRHNPREPGGVEDNHVTALYEGSEGLLWTGYADGVVRTFDPETKTFTRIAEMGDIVLTIMEDRSGVIWVGGDNVGLLKISRFKNPFQHWRPVPDNTPNQKLNHMTAVYEDRSGRLWFGTQSSGIIIYDPANNTTTRYNHDPREPDGLNENNIAAIVGDHEGLIWIGTNSAGLQKLDPNTGQFTLYRKDKKNPGSLIHDRIRTLFVDSAGTLWVGVRDGLHRYLRETDRFQRFIWKQGSATDPIDKVRKIYEDRSGTLWIGTDGGLLEFYPEKGTHFLYRNDPLDPYSLSFDKVRVIHEDRQGVLWVGTRTGLNRFDRNTKRFTYYTSKDGLPSDIIYGLLEDAKGLLWLSTPQGLSKFNPQTEVFRNYGTEDGLLNRNFEKSACFKTSKGEMFFGGLAGADSFFPDQIMDNPHIPPIVMTGFKIFDRPVDFGVPITELETVEVLYKENFISFEFSALDFTDQELNRYAYQMEGFDPDWIYCGTRRFANYTNLNPGTYTFRVKGSNNDGVWNEEGASVILRIVPPIWMTRWFRALAAFALLLLVLAVHQAVTRGIRKRNRQLQDINRRLHSEIDARVKTQEELQRKQVEMEQFTYTVSHDLKSPLITIRGFLGMLEKVTAGEEKAKRFIDRIYAASGTMGQLLDDLLQLSRVGRLDNPHVEIAFDELAQQAVRLVHGPLIDRGVRILITPGLPMVRGDRSRLVGLLQNLIENAVKFMGEQEEPFVEIGCRREEPDPVFYVRDNGSGIDPAYHEKIFGLFDRLDQDIEGTGMGLAMVRKVAETHGGRIWVESKGFSHGATFCFTLPGRGDAV